VEVAEFLNISLDEFHVLLNEARGVGLISIDELYRYLDDGHDRNLLEYVADSETFDLVELLYFDQVYHIVVKAVEQLPEKERLVISLYYYERLTMREVGEILKVSESRISQIHTRAIMRLRGRLMRVLKA
jgi:RNA polymerase sigma factor for flagellar operon FliA